MLVSERVCDEMGTLCSGKIMTFEDNHSPARTEKKTQKIDISWPG